MVTVSGETWQCEGTGLVHLQLDGGTAADVRAITMKPLGFALILGMDGIKVLG